MNDRKIFELITRGKPKIMVARELAKSAKLSVADATRAINVFIKLSQGGTIEWPSGVCIAAAGRGGIGPKPQWAIERQKEKLIQWLRQEHGCALPRAAFRAAHESTSFVAKKPSHMTLEESNDPNQTLHLAIQRALGDEAKFKLDIKGDSIENISLTIFEDKRDIVILPHRYHRNIISEIIHDELAGIGLEPKKLQFFSRDPIQDAIKLTASKMTIDELLAGTNELAAIKMTIDKFLAGTNELAASKMTIDELLAGTNTEAHHKQAALTLSSRTDEIWTNISRAKTRPILLEEKAKHVAKEIGRKVLSSNPDEAMKQAVFTAHDMGISGFRAIVHKQPGEQELARVEYYRGGNIHPPESGLFDFADAIVAVDKIQVHIWILLPHNNSILPTWTHNRAPRNVKKNLSKLSRT